MDLTIEFNKKEKSCDILNIRVLVLVKTENGYIFEKHLRGYLYSIGGRIKLHESSKEAAKREFHEEIGIDFNIEKFKYICSIENFYMQDIYKIHEISFVYKVEEILNLNLSENFTEINISKLENTDLKPEILKQVILDLENNNHKTSYITQ